MLIVGVSLGSLHRISSAKRFRDALASFGSEADWRRVIHCRSKLLPSGHPSHELDLFEVSLTPGAYQQVQSQFQKFKDTKPPLERFRHERNHFLAGLESAQEPSADRASRIRIGFQIIPYYSIVRTEFSPP
jgi:hypothetical protein